MLDVMYQASRFTENDIQPFYAKICINGKIMVKNTLANVLGHVVITV